MAERLVRAPKLDAAHLPWFNVRGPLDLPDLAGKIVILDFWTYCCINCIHVIPTLKRLEARFPDNLLVLGVHSPKFPGEKETKNLEQAILRYEIEHPIVHDVDFGIWKRYAVSAWPTLLFLSPDGYILGQLPGEPDADHLEQTLDHLVAEMKKNGLLQGAAGDLIQIKPPAPAGALSFPGKIAYSAADREFAVADCNHHQIVTAAADGRITRRIGSGTAGRRDGSLAAAEFFRPQGLCYQDGVIWVADTENHLLRQVDLSTGQVTTVAGTGVQGGFLRQTLLGKEAALSSPWDVTLADGWLYFANAGTHQIGVYYLQEDQVALFAGTGQEAILDGPRLTAALAQPSGLSVGGDKLYFADSETSAVRSVRLDRIGLTATYIGSGLFDFGDKDGTGREAVLQHPLDVHHVDGAVFIADSYNHKIKVLDLATQEVHTVEASVDLICEDDSCTRLWEPAGVLCLDRTLYVSDTNNHRVLKIDLDTEKTQVFIR
ncbi:MAG: thioredoxin-like domain-containing protein [Nitrospinaceae bacterium]